MSKLKKDSKYSDSHVFAIGGKEGSLSYYIYAVTKEITQPESYNFRNAIYNFRKFVTTRYKMSKDTNDEIHFFNEVFSALSYQQLEQNSLLCIILLSELMSIDIGDKILRANKIGEDLSNLPAATSSLYWKRYQKILLWLHRTLGQSFQLILTQLYEKMLIWFDDDREVEVIAGLQLLTIFAQCFPTLCYSSPKSFETCLEKIFLSIVANSFNVRLSASYTLRYVLRTTPFSFGEQLCQYFLEPFEDREQSDSYPGIAESLVIILEEKPEFKEFLKFKEVPLTLLQSFVTNIRLCGYHSLPVVYKTTPELFTPDIWFKVFDTFQLLFANDVPDLKKSLSCFTELVFLKKGEVSDQEKAPLKNILEFLLDRHETEHKICALTSLLSIFIENAEEITRVVFAYPLRESTSLALAKLIKIHPKLADTVYNYIMKTTFPNLISKETVASILTISLRALINIEIPTTYLSEQLVLQYSLHLSHKDIDVRNAAADFVLMYHNKTLSASALHRLLAVLMTETNQSLRIRIMSSIRKKPCDETTIYMLKTLMRDATPEISLSAMRFLSKYCQIPEVFAILNQFLLETISNIKHAPQITRQNVQYFYVLEQNCIKDKIYSVCCDKLISPFRVPMLNILLHGKQLLPHVALLLITSLLPYTDNNFSISELAYQITSNLSIQTKESRILAALNLLNIAIDKTTIILEHNGELMSSLFALTRRNFPKEFKETLICAISKLAAFKPSLYKDIKEKHKNATSPNIFIDQCDAPDATGKMLYVSASVTLMSLLDILSNNTLSQLHQLAIDALVKTLKSNRLLGNFVEEKLIGRYMEMLKQDSHSVLLLGSIPTLESSVSHKNFAPLLPLIIDSICQKWSTSDHSMLEQISTWLVHSMPDVMKPYLPRLVTVMLSDLSTIESILSTLVNFKSAISSVVHIIYPVILDWISNNSGMIKTCEKVLEKFKVIIKNGGSQKYAVNIINALMKAVQTDFALKKSCIDVIFVVAVQMGPYFLLHIPSLNPTFIISDYPKFSEYVKFIEQGKPIPPDILSEVTPEPVIPLPKAAPPSMKHNPVKLDEPSIEYQTDEWEDWFEELCQTLLIESSSRAISACYILALRYVPLLNTIFPIAFTLLLTQVGEPVLKIVKTVLESKTTPQYIREYFLAVIENLELLDYNIPVDDRIILENCMLNKRYPQAMRAAERIFEKDDTIGCQLLEQYMILGLADCAHGLSKVLKPTPAALERLGHYTEALNSYENILENDPMNVDAIVGTIHCLWNLANFDEVIYTAKLHNMPYYLGKGYAARFEFSKLFEVTRRIDVELLPTKFLAIVKGLINNDYDYIKKNVAEIRWTTGSAILPTISNDYKRNYEEYMKLALLSTVEDVANAMKTNDKTHLKLVSDYKFNVVSYSTNTLLSMILILSMIYDRDDLKKYIVKYIKIAIAEKKFTAAEFAFTYFDKDRVDSDFNMLRCELLYAQGQRELAISQLIPLAKSVDAIKRVANYLVECDKQMQARNILIDTVKTVSNDMELWQQLTRVNFFLYEYTLDEEFLTDSFKAALNGLALGNESLSLSIRVIQILFQHRSPEILKLFEDNVQSIPTHVWIVVLPQIIARISSKESDLAGTLQNLIMHVGSEHPQPVLYSLLVPLEGDSKHRKKAALQLTSFLESSYPQAVQSISILSEELMRVACTRYELCYNSIRDALFDSNDQPFEHVKQLIKTNKITPETFIDVAFSREFGALINTLEDWVNEYEKTLEPNALNMAMGTMANIWIKIKPVPATMMSLNLKDVSKVLSEFDGFKSLMVPGTFKNGEPLITMSSFTPVLDIIDSLHRPRKILIYGSNGETYTFLLKAHEDTRLDERVMQLFDFINSFASHKRMHLTTYKVTPLTGNVGLIGWVSNCTTLANIILKHRNKTFQSTHAEMEASLAAANVQSEKEFYDIPPEERQKHFKAGLCATPGNDIQSALLLQAANSSDWVNRRTQYASSLAVTSMVGYLIGIGDRHLNNIMLDSNSGKLIHIDYSDCFEVRMHDDVFPETVPFRLTRLLVNALELKRIEGTFRATCVNIMRDLQSRGDQILALLEVFIYDPLLQWIPVVGSSHSSVGSGTPVGHGERILSIQTLQRIKDKLHRTDGADNVKRTLEEQVDNLISQACDPLNLCKMHHGWNPWL